MNQDNDTRRTVLTDVRNAAALLDDARHCRDDAIRQDAALVGRVTAGRAAGLTPERVRQICKQPAAVGIAAEEERND